MSPIYQYKCPNCQREFDSKPIPYHGRLLKENRQCKECATLADIQISAHAKTAMNWEHGI